jgi:dTDP-glucose 4,6-dehydratase
MRILVCGGAGFIGSNFIRRLLGGASILRDIPRDSTTRPPDSPDLEVVNLDKLTYAGNPDNLRTVQDHPGYCFIHGDICDRETVLRAAQGVDAIVNFAAETHVDRSIVDPEAFLRTDILGTYTLLEAVRELGIPRFVQVSTDEVYGSVAEGSCNEDAPCAPSSPYSASKAGADLQVLAYYRTYGLPVMVTRGSNTYGPYQYPEKLIPLFVTNALEGERLPLYGDGLNVRDWLHVDDHCSGIEFVLMHGEPGQVYNIGGGNERTNLEITRLILDELRLGEDMIQRVPDRPGHDRRYSLDCGKLARMGWRPQVEFDPGLRETIRWYRDNEWWWKRIKHQSADFARWKRRWYEERQAPPESATGGGDSTKEEA